MGNALEQRKRPGIVVRRLAWFVVLWGLGVAGLAVVALLLKGAMHAGGMR